MTTRAFLAALRREAAADGSLNRDFDVLDLLDYAAIFGIPGAAAMYRAAVEATHAVQLLFVTEVVPPRPTRRQRARAVARRSAADAAALQEKVRSYVAEYVFGERRGA